MLTDPCLALRECAVSGHTHDLAVDIWALGLLVFQLSAGNRDVIDPDELQGPLGVESHIQRVLNTRRADFPDLLSADWFDFVRRCLVQDPRARMTAGEAMRHPWLNEPASCLAIFKKRELETTRTWRPREIVLPTIVDLSNV